MSRPLDGKVARTSAPEGGAANLTFGEGEYRPKSAALVDSFLARWNRLSLERRFLIAATLSVGISMLTLGYWVEKQVRSGWLHGMAETGAIYLEAILAPHLQVLATSAELPEAERSAIAALIADTRLSGRVAMIKIWNTKGELLFSTGRTSIRETLPASLLQKVKSGHVSVDVEFDDKGDHSPVPASLLEIYAPMYKRGTREIIAIGEFYEFSRALEAEIVRVKYATWFLIINVALIISVLLFVTVKRASRIITTQQRLLESNLERAAALARRNNSLRRAADRARLKAAVLNENYLARIGADLHDGPIQMLSLLMLKLPDPTAPDTRPLAIQRSELESLIQMTLNDLRNLSVGLVLPELKHLSFAETVELVITRHEQQTGTMVRREIGAMPVQASEAVKVCAYRITQEALTNAYKHAGAADQFVHVDAGHNMVTLTISDSGGPPSPRAGLAQTASLGVRGMESRVQALRGTLSISRNSSGGTEVVAQIPIRPQAESGKPATSPEEAPGRPT
ncbi:MAG TPA: ATP-binding protein [Bosea sp. (in: a-proteobacteria)]